MVENEFLWALFGDGAIFGVPSPALLDGAGADLRVRAAAPDLVRSPRLRHRRQHTAAHYSGIEVEHVKLAVFTLTGNLAGFAG